MESDSKLEESEVTSTVAPLLTDSMLFPLVLNGGKGDYTFTCCSDAAEVKHKLKLQLRHITIATSAQQLCNSPRLEEAVL